MHRRDPHSPAPAPVGAERRVIHRYRVLAAAAIAVALTGVGVLAVHEGRTGSGMASPVAAAEVAAPRVVAPPAPMLHPSRRFWMVTALGDSVVSGSHCDCDAFAQRYAVIAARMTGVTVGVANLGVPGQTSAGLSAELTGGPAAGQAVQGSVAGSDIVLVTIGANDLLPALTRWQSSTCDLSCFTRVLPSIAAHIGAVVQQIYRLRSGRTTEVLVTDYWNVFRDGRVGAALGARYQQLSDQVTRLANRTICRAATGAGATCVDLYAPFKGINGTRDPTALLADDGDHPDAAGHGLIAATLAAHGWAELGDQDDAGR